MANARNILALLRPRQWTKNLAVFAGVIFSGNLLEPTLLGRSFAAFGALCLVAGGLYAINDATDAQRDRQHPIKRNRPVASGAIPVRTAAILGLALVVAGLASSWLLGAAFFACVAGYLVAQLLYGLWLKNVAIVDILAIAAGFVVRAVAGAVVIDVPVSPWLVLCTGLLALFLAAAKRRHELTLLGTVSASHRPVLAEYSAELLDSFMVTLSAATITSYALYTFFEVSAPGYLMMLTIPFVVYGVLRYQTLVLRSDAGGRPEEVLLGDGPIQVDIALWLFSAILVLYALPHFIG